ncbi:MAG: ATP-binding protein [Candidatus Thermoplasmatota archaeon]|nr:ATP-binding protein [Euryarchaeota archaeon]MBU4031478.1 ATP-binding protein [Candidatus Thermoplasmatota archaeon]MBU4071293.1 ATP-binding protein [Candidatus Thermoplasmatota archaeon]MBU4144640.1 ATP-binding protein [Candidatus Thermoplasmatota archaeon]MBU4592470.1 ATP-binding protein [Candidatus Thermoplasmatota archaeon]
MISKDVLEDIAESWSGDIVRENVIWRDIMAGVEDSLKYEEVTVIKGVRRAGKTFILFHMLQKHGGIYLNFEDDRLYNFDIGDFEKVLDMVRKLETPILYLDEVQHVAGWEKFAHRVHRKVKLFVTGSNSGLLSSDYATSLVGRTKSFDVFPLSFTEFLRFTGKRKGRGSFLDYMDTGGFPRIVISGDTSLANEYLDRIIYRDILGTENIRYPEALKTLALYLLSNVGKEFSFRTLKEVSSIGHESTVKDYLGLLRDAYLVGMINRYDPSLKVQESYGKKLYAMDTAFISLGKRMERDTGRVLENMVFLHLKQKGHDLFYGKNGKEVDFIVCDSLNPLKIVNVTFEAANKKTLQREIDSLHYFQEKINVPAELVSLYPSDVPGDIQFHLAHRYMG